MKIFRITIKKDKKKCAQFDVQAEFCEGAIEEACKIYFGGKLPTGEELVKYEYICQQIKNDKGDNRIYPENISKN